MRFFVKGEDGKFRKATADEVMSTDVVLYVLRGEEYVKLDSATPPEKQVKANPVEELSGVIKELALNVGGIAAIKQKQEEMEAKIAAYEEQQKKGFPMWGNVQPGSSPQEVDEFVKGWEIVRQGQRLMDKVTHPLTHMTEEKRIEMAKYFCLLLKATMMDDPFAKMKMREVYGKTNIGDSGNTFPIPDIIDSEILWFARERSVVLQNARIWDMTSEKQSFPVESAGVTVGWGNTTSNSDPTITEFELDAEELSAYSYVRNTTLADSRSDVVSWIAESMAEAAGQEIDNKAFNGLGTDSPFICSGILSANCGYSVTMGTGSSSFSNLYASVLSEMIGKLDGLRKVGARFWLGGNILHYVRSLLDSQGRPIFIETVGAPMSGTIWGYPYTEVVKLASISDAASTAFMAFGNMRYFGVGRRLDTAALSVNPYTNTAFTTNRTAFKMYQRWALGMALRYGFCRLLTAA